MATTTIDSLTDIFGVLDPEVGIKQFKSSPGPSQDFTSVLGKRKASEGLEADEQPKVRAEITTS